jgi:hypothetical protein
MSDITIDGAHKRNKEFVSIFSIQLNQTYLGKDSLKYRTKRFYRRKIWRFNLLGYRSIPYRFIWQQRPTSCMNFINPQIQQATDKAIENAKDNLGLQTVRLCIQW